MPPPKLGEDEGLPEAGWLGEEGMGAAGPVGAWLTGGDRAGGLGGTEGLLP